MMLPHEQFRALLTGGPPLLALAPMQDVTDGPFWSLVHRYGGADVYWTEYFRVHVDFDAGEVDRRLDRPATRPDGRSSRS